MKKVKKEKRRILFEFCEGKTHRIESYIEKGGFKTLKRILKELKPDEVIEEIKNSGLRGRGGAGFPTGLKWHFIPKKIKPKFLICNADEGEPGTFKDRELMEKAPYLLIEGIAIASYAIGAEKAFIYLRKEYPVAKEKLLNAIKDSIKHNFLGNRILGTKLSLDIKLFVGAGAYICGEETALLESMEGKKGLPRLKPPYPAVSGFRGYPTAVNNVETLCNVPVIMEKGAKWFRSFGTEKSPGTKMFSVSGAVKRPGVYEFEMGKITLSELVYEVCGAEKIEGVFPGGISTPPLKHGELDIPLDFESLFQKGTFLGSGGVIVFDRRIPLIRILRKTAEFFKNESCGKCTPCREGTLWLSQILKGIEEKRVSKEGLDLAIEVCEKIKGKCLCPLGETCAISCEVFIRKFKEEIEGEM